jgi:hypothetical protein
MYLQDESPNDMNGFEKSVNPNDATCMYCNGKLSKDMSGVERIMWLMRKDYEHVICYNVDEVPSSETSVNHQNTQHHTPETVVPIVNAVGTSNLT